MEILSFSYHQRLKVLANLPFVEIQDKEKT